MTETPQEDLGFTFLATKKGDVLIYRDGKRIVMLAGKEALKFLNGIDDCSFGEQQQRLARVTGNYKRGNEKLGKKSARG